jgi:hypothetical protein
MEKKGEIKNDLRLELIKEQLIKYTQLDFSGHIHVSENSDEIDAIIVGLNTLGEELSEKKIR